MNQHEVDFAHVRWGYPYLPSYYVLAQPMIYAWADGRMAWIKRTRGEFPDEPLSHGTMSCLG
jgi:hypothetical protein